MIDLNREPKKQEAEEPLGMVIAYLMPFLVIFFAAGLWRL